MVVYGPSGVGKTSFCANFPKVGVIHDPQEGGILSLLQFKQCPEPVFHKEMDNFEKTLLFLEKVATDTLGIRTLVADSATGFEKLCFQYHCREHFDNDWSKEGFYSYQQGPKNAAKTDWPMLVDALDNVRRAGINVIIIAHSQVKNFQNPVGPDYDKYTPYLDKESWQVLHRWAQAVLFYNYYVDIEKKKGGIKPKVKEETECRQIYTQHSAAFDAKNWYGLEPIIDAGDSGTDAFDNFVRAFKSAGK